MMHHTIDWLLWRSLHLLFTIFCLLCSAISRARKFLSGAVFTSTESAAAANGLEDKAVAVAVVFEDLQGVDWIDKVSMLVSWLSAINVTHVTLFDPHDVLKESQKSLQKVLKFLAGEDQQVYCYTHKRSQLRCDLDGSRSPLESYQSKFISREDNCLLGELSGLRKRKVEYQNAGGGDNVSVNASDVARVRDLKVELLSLADGKEALVRAARNVCENAYKLHYANHHQSKLPKLTEQDVNDSLQVNGSEGPDPDLLLLFGKTRSLHGFPPWRLRLTEIVHMGSLEQMSASSLVGALKEFAKKTHRYGR